MRLMKLPTIDFFVKNKCILFWKLKKKYVVLNLLKDWMFISSHSFRDNQIFYRSLKYSSHFVNKEITQRTNY